MKRVAKTTILGLALMLAVGGLSVAGTNDSAPTQQRLGFQLMFGQMLGEMAQHMARWGISFGPGWGLNGLCDPEPVMLQIRDRDRSEEVNRERNRDGEHAPEDNGKQP